MARLAVRAVSRGAVEARVQANAEHATHVPDKSMDLARKCKARYLFFFLCVSVHAIIKEQRYMM